MEDNRFKYYLLMQSAATKWLFYSLLGAAFLLVGGSYAYQAYYEQPVNYQQGNFHEIVNAPENIVELSNNTYRRYSVDEDICAFISESSIDQERWESDRGVRYDLSHHKTCSVLDFSLTSDDEGGLTLTYKQKDPYSGEVKEYEVYSEPGDYGWEFAAVSE